MPAEATVTELNAYGYYQAGSDNPSTVYLGDTTTVENVLVNTWSLKAYMAEHAASVAPPLEADLRLDQGMIVGTVRNRLNVPLQDVAVVRGGASQHIGFVAAGGTADVRLALSTQVFNNASPADLLPAPAGISAPQPGYPYPYYSRDMTAEQRTYNRKIELLSAGLYPYVGDLPPLDMRVTLLAWGPAAPDPIAVERYTAQLEEATLWVSQATVRAAGQGDGSIAPGMVPYTVYAPAENPSWLTWNGAYGGPQLAPGQAFPQPVPSSPVPAMPGPVPTVSVLVQDGVLDLSPYVDVRYALPPGSQPATVRLDYTFTSSPSLPISVLAYRPGSGDWAEVGTLGPDDSTNPGAVATSKQITVPDAAQYIGPAGDLTIRLTPAASDPGNGAATLGSPSFNIAVNPDRQ
jgi:hypothetical protein